MSENYDVQTPNIRRPKVLITGLSEKLNEERIVKAIRNQNCNIEFKELKCIKVFRSVKNPQFFNAIIEIDDLST